MQLFHQPDMQHGPDTVFCQTLQPLLAARVLARTLSELRCLWPVRVAGQAKHLVHQTHLQFWCPCQLWLPAPQHV